MNIGKLLIVTGIVFIIIGLLWRFIGKLPGDIQFKTGNVTVYFPIVTSIVVSIILTIVFYFISRFR
ncbi:DUF2905 domain-containing protein [Oceanobacillus luteolus]|uniref:DUF2905 domain-containing protein n=1 Tax=Oceanobacillus luteolus TaxID=1274358 RepID=A0ABW4HUN2_9BACI|nr:DUF2905 domain-containing protein [Oceanobacillus luteolus]MCM3742215.1 DUF2905 domain-containing protein [Oceanobacillus luteolus]